MEKIEPTQEELAVEALKRLHHNADFILWREKVAKPLINQWENDLLLVSQMSEAEVKSKVMVTNTLKALFYSWFENIEAQEKAQKEVKKEIAN